MPRPGYVRQPGAAREPRLCYAPARGVALTLALEQGMPLLAAAEKALSLVGYYSAVLELRDLTLGPFGYVMPALARDGRNAAYYSAIHRPPGLTQLAHGAMTFGRREGAPFFHAHGLWREADGRESGGHLLPEETILARPARVTALAFTGAGYVWRHDSEINFTVPGPVAGPDTAERAESHLLRVRPNIEIHDAVEDYCRAAGIRSARLRGGVGSTIGALFDDGREVGAFATEVFIENGQIAPDAMGHPVAEIDIGLIDHTGRIERGRLKRGNNPVLMTFELALEVTG